MFSLSILHSDGHTLKYLYSIFVLGFIIPLGVICYCYGRIMLKVKHTEKRAKRFVSKDIKDNPMWRAFTDTVTQPFVKYGMKKAHWLTRM